MLAYNSSDLSSLLPAEAERARPRRAAVGLYARRRAWSSATRQTSVNQTGYNFTIAGFTAGADYRVRDHLLVGLATGYSHTGAGFHGSGGGVRPIPGP